MCAARPVRLSGTENRHNAIQKSHAEVGFIGGLGQPSTYGVPSAPSTMRTVLSLLIENGADRSSISLGDDEHPKSMAVCTTAGKRDARYPYVGERTLSDIDDVTAQKIAAL